MLSYILENKEVDGKKTVEYFRDKFADDPATFMLIDNATKGQTETILFNIDIEGSINKGKTVVLRVFAKMFYTHLGLYGENLKVAMLEKYIEHEGKIEAFRKAFEERKGKPWVEQRKAFAFNGNFIVPALMEILGLSEADAQSWFKDKSAVEFSIAQLVEDIKEYVNSKPKDFRLLFMIDEAGQYVGTDTDMLLNLQSLIEKIGSECGCKVWVICTGQEAIDEIIKVRADEFSRIQARFKTRLSLTSSSVDEVIQKRMADDIRTDKITLREAVRSSLDRLMSQNYIGRTGDTYNFLTDEEQDIQREIKNTSVDTSNIVERIAQMIYGDIYTSKKYRYGKYDFAYDQMVDGVTVGAVTGGMKLKFLTVATDSTEKNEMTLMAQSRAEAIVVLAETPYYESLEIAMKIRKYVKQRNVPQLPKSVQDIIRDQQEEANKYDQTAMVALKKAIEGAEYYVDGEHLTFKGGDAKSKIDQSLEYLVTHV